MAAAAVLEKCQMAISRSCPKSLSVWSVVNSSHILSRTVFFPTYSQPTDAVVRPRLLFSRSSLICSQQLIVVKSLSSAYWICALPSTPRTMTFSSTGCTTPSVSVIISFHGSQVSSPDGHRGSVSEASTRHTLQSTMECHRGAY